MQPSEPAAAPNRVAVAYAELKAALAEMPQRDRAEALGPHAMVGEIDCDLCGEGMCHYLHVEPMVDGPLGHLEAA